MRVVFVVLDGLPPRHVNERVTPVLHGLARAGGWHRDGGRAVMASSTYPNHRTFATGVSPLRHGVLANQIVRDGQVVAAEDVTLAVPTVFDRIGAAGYVVEAVFGDHHLVGVMGATTATRHWPPDGVLPDGLPLDWLGYLDDTSTQQEALGAIDRQPDLLVMQLNLPDTAGHVLGPDSDGAHDAYRATDRRLGDLAAALRPQWHDVVLIIVSDHDQEMVSDAPGIDLAAAVRGAGIDAQVVHEGSAALVVGDDPALDRWLNDVTGVSQVATLAARGIEPGTRLVSATPGRWFGPAETTRRPRGVHGGRSTRNQVAVVAGGHPHVSALAHALHARCPRAEDWAPTLAALFDTDLPSASGRSLL